MLTEREQAVRNILLDQLGERSWVEHRHIKDRVDTNFIDDGLKSMRHRRFLCFGFFILAALVFIGLLVAIVREVGETSTFLTLLSLVLSVLLWTSTFVQLSRKRMIYKVLRIFSEN